MAQNLGVADVARQLKLSIKQVEALEAGDFGRRPGPVFVRGFVRNYARLLQLDAEPLLEAVRAVLPREEPLPMPSPPEVPFPTPSRTRWHGYVALAAVIVAALAAYEFFSGTPEQAARESTDAEPAVAPAIPVAPDGPVTPSSARGGQVETASGARTGLDRSAGSVAPLSQPAAGASERGQSGNQIASGSAPASQDVPPKSSARDEEPIPASDERQVHMVFDQASWVEIRDRSGKAIFSQLNAPGTEQRVNGRPPLAVVVGNAHGVRLTYDERPVNLALHTRIDVARLRLQ
jgi:cytoskeleton protein RodZ